MVLRESPAKTQDKTRGQQKDAKGSCARLDAPCYRFQSELKSVDQAKQHLQQLRIAFEKPDKTSFCFSRCGAVAFFCFGSNLCANHFSGINFFTFIQRLIQKVIIR